MKVQATGIGPSYDGGAIDAGFDNFVVGSLFLAFIIFITAKGELSTYLQLFLYTPPAASTTTASAGTSAPNVVQNVTGTAAAASTGSLAPIVQSGANIASGITQAGSLFNSLFGSSTSVSGN